MSWFKKQINTDEYLELKKALESLRIRFEGLQLEFDLIRKKLKIKKGLAKDNDEEESKDLKDMMFLPK